MGRVYRRTTREASYSAAALLACCYALVLLSNTTAITTFTNVLVGMEIGWFVV